MGARKLLSAPNMYDALGEDRREYELYAARAEARLMQLKKVTPEKATTSKVAPATAG